MQHKRFTEFLRFKGYQKATDIFWLEPNRLNLPWNTKYNTADSGIFLMRHMETYFGGENLFYAEKFVEESVSAFFYYIVFCSKNIYSF